MKAKKAKLNLRGFARRIASAYIRSTSATAEVVREVLLADNAIQKQFKKRSERKQQRRKLTTAVGKLLATASLKANMSSILSQTFLVCGARPSVRTQWLAGKYGKPFTIALVKHLHTKSGNGKGKSKTVDVRQTVYQFVQKRGMNVAKFAAYVHACVALLARVKRAHVRGAIKFRRNRYGLVIA